MPRRTDWQRQVEAERHDRREADLTAREARVAAIIDAAKALRNALWAVDRAYWKHLGPGDFEGVESREADAYRAVQAALQRWYDVEKEGRL